jgi:gliding motility-associated-like protein
MQAQVNLVPNPGFDEFDDCPTADANLAGYVRDWYIAKNSPDYFNSCSATHSTPINSCGNQIPRSGGAYMGAGIYSANNTINVPLEMFQVKLKERLKPEKKYCVSFFVSPVEATGYFLDCFDAFISKATLIYPNNIVDGSLVPQVSNISGNIISDTTLWTEISGEFIAEGDEEYLTLGCFKTQVGIDTIRNYPSVLGFQSTAYYFFEDVNLYYCDENTLELIDMPNIFTPNNDNVNDFFIPSGHENISAKINMIIYNRWGGEVFKTENALIDYWNGTTPSGIAVSAGVYYYVLHDEKNTKSGFVQVAY